MAPLEIEEDEGSAAALPIWLVAVMEIVTLMFGFLLGTRAKMILAAAKVSGKALITLKELIMAGSKDAEDDGAADAVDEPDEDNKDEPPELLEKFLSNETTYGLDDHADIVRNPVLMYQVGQAKAAARREIRKQQLIADGMDEEDAEQALIDEMTGALGSSGGGPSAGQNPLATLIAAGARVTALADSMGADAAQAEERRRQARTIDAYLTKSRGIDTTKTQRPKVGEGVGRKKASALEVAIRSKDRPFGGLFMQLDGEKIKMAKDGRVMLRALHKRRKAMGLAYVPPKDNDTGKKEVRRTGSVMSAEEQANILAQLANEDPDGEGDDDEADEDMDDDVDDEDYDDEVQDEDQKDDNLKA